MSEITCRIYKDDTPVFCSTASGIYPLIWVIGKKLDVKGMTADDKIVGKAAALLYSYMGVKKVNAGVVTFDALNILASNGIECTYNVVTEKIINRQKTDICPMEKIVADTNDPMVAYRLLSSKVKLSTKDKIS